MSRINIKMFDRDLCDSPVNVIMNCLSPVNWDEPNTSITPYSQQSEQTKSDVTPECNTAFRRHHSFNVKRSLFSGKRPASHLDTEETIQLSKRSKDTEKYLTQNNLQASPDQSVDKVIHAVERLSMEEDLVADGSRDYCLPTVSGKHKDLKSISPDTMADVLRGCFDDKVEHVTIVDCRYPYEFKGGHIKGAVNLYTKESVNQLLHLPGQTDKRHILIFHCEFSSERGPKMYRFLRSQDRMMNSDNYPKLNFPEIYLLEGGYKAFYESFQDLCDPISYKPMLHENHTAELRHFRVKSKSWSAGDTKHKYRSRPVHCLRF